MRLLTLFVMGALSLLAQDTQALMPPYSEVARFLGLTPNQVQSLQQVQRRKAQAEQAIYQEMQEKERALWALLNENSNDASRVGTLMIEINQLRKKVPVGGEPYRGEALNVLTTEQKTKLPALTNALVTAPAGYEAVYLNLIDDPRQVHIMPARAVSSVMPEPGGIAEIQPSR